MTVEYEQMYGLPDTRDGNLWVVVIVKSWVNKLAGSWLAAQEWTTNQKPGQQVDPTLDNEYNLYIFPLQLVRRGQDEERQSGQEYALLVGKRLLYLPLPGSVQFPYAI